jgi:hypothetical protein
MMLKTSDNDSRLSTFKNKGERDDRRSVPRYQYFYERAFSVFGGHLSAFVNNMVERDHATSTVTLYLNSCITALTKQLLRCGSVRSVSRRPKSMKKRSIRLRSLVRRRKPEGFPDAP